MKDSLKDSALWTDMGLERGWGVRMWEREDKLWRGKMDSSNSSLEVYRQVVRKRGEMDRWVCLEEGIRVWWRRFRGGMLMGKRRGNWWKEEKCDVCGREEGGVGHFIFKCIDKKVVELRTNVLSEVGKGLVVWEEYERWCELSEEEKLWVTVGKRVEGLDDVWENGARSWYRKWESGKWKENLEGKNARSEP